MKHFTIVVCAFVAFVTATTHRAPGLAAQVPGVPKPNQQPQPRFPSNLDSLSLDSLEQMDNADLEQFKLDETEFISYYSHGWFPTPFPASSLSFFNNVLGFRIDHAPSIRPQGTVPMRDGFTSPTPFDERRHRWVLKSGYKGDKDSHYEDTYPTDDNMGNRIGLRYSLHLPLPLMLRVALTYDSRRNLLFATDRTKRYLGEDGTPQEFYEVAVLQHDEKILGGSLGFTIPVYGAFLKPVGEMAVASYYYLHLGAATDYVLESAATQYVQIANVKENLRYRNGLDTLRLIDGQRLPGLSQWRPAIEVAFGAGWSVGGNLPRIKIGQTTLGGPFGLDFTAEGFIHIPTVGIFADERNNAVWRQYTFGIRIATGYQWLH